MKLKNAHEWSDKIATVTFTVLGYLNIVFVAVICLYLLISGIPAIYKIGFVDFIFGTQWASTAAEPKFGIMPFILTSIYGTIGAIALGLPIGFFCSVYLAKFAPVKIKKFVESTVDLLAGIPSVVFGFIGMLVLVPGIKEVFGVPDGSSLLAAILVLSVMILPSIIKVSIGAIEAVPHDYELGSLALGANKVETVYKVVVPAARRGIGVSVVLGVGRAIGEAMAVMMVAGNVANMPGLFASVRFLTTAVASEMSYSAGLQREALFSIALVLFVFIMVINALLNLALKKKDSK
ncbi:MAG: phosphate ABC transporter permease subunit PstC [Succinivibrionaceae bacterium]|nr:phosphate ABC transporter permease subunit PstC [Succinivibrionaceae bacterium]